MGKDRDNVYINENRRKKKKRKRTVITPEENDRLENMFKKEPLPDRLAKIELAKEIGRPETFVNIWFQNRRARERRSSKGSEGTFLGTMDSEPLNLSKTGADNSIETAQEDVSSGSKDNTVSLVRSPLFGRIVRMAAAAENGILQHDSPYLGEALTDACRGIDLADGKLVYHSIYGFSFQKK